MRRRRGRNHNDLMALLAGLGDIWAIFALAFLVLFFGTVPSMEDASSSQLSLEDQEQLVETLGSVIEEAKTARDQRDKAEQKATAIQGQFEQARADATAQRSRAETAEQEARTHQRRVSDAVQRAEKAGHQLATRSMETVFLIDESGSMGQIIRDLDENVETLAEVLAPVAPLRVGVVGYRLKDDQRRFDLSLIEPSSDDGGRSLNNLRRFTGSLTATNSSTDLEAAVERGMAMLAGSTNQAGKQTLVLCSDVGPFEASGSSPQRAQRLQQRILDWLRADPRRAVVAIFTGDTERDRAWYRGLEQAGGDRVVVSENPAEMLPALLRGMTNR